MSPRTIRRSLLSTALLAAVMASGCGSHYHVTETSSGKSYYTKSIDRNRRTDTVKFKDAKSGAEVTLTSSEIKEISKDEFNAAVKSK